MRCAECGGELVLVDGPLREELRGEEYTVYGIERYECATCGEYVIDADQEKKLSSELWRCYKQTHATLSPSEIIALRKDLRVTQTEFGKLVAANDQTVSRWEHGRVVPSASANKLMALLRDCPEARKLMFEMAEVKITAPASVYSVSQVHEQQACIPAVFSVGTKHFSYESVGVA